ncbi:modification methylase [candidate division LCP-89 bacterium B3_LCP]|uniref:Methyltransferase n=1 Tax=candidate division LCP-89 bacterium B3_LCP TaxID=2012998 RepID=A0A532UYS0_UNCL8|nr:MAG: modification methylase [candidate division LCP-89 bacterium B3_LCP]
MDPKVYCNKCDNFLDSYSGSLFDLSFLDPPFNQKKEYSLHNDDMLSSEYWSWMERICKLIYKHTSDGGAIYFMQREKNTKHILSILDKSGWTFQNLIIWQKKTSAVPGTKRYGKHYQVIAFYTKGKKPRIFNKLRIDKPLLVTQREARPNGVFVTDVWDDIRELTSGYYAGDEPLRHRNGERVHKQQSPVKLLTRIIISSSKVNDLVFDPFVGTGTTLVAANQLHRRAIGIEVDPENVEFIKRRLTNVRNADLISKFRKDYRHTKNLDAVWPVADMKLKNGEKSTKQISIEI